MQDFVAQPNMVVDPVTPQNSYVDEYQPPSSMPMPAATLDTPDNTKEALEDQNIFELLGVSDGTDEEKEAFLLELQRVLWDDFLQYDVQLLITKEEYAELQTQRDSKTSAEEKEEAVVAYLEKLIPDLEEIMLEKALELKGDMVRERITGLRELYASDPDKIAELDKAATYVQAGSWRSAATTLNALPTS
ncbi:MAG: hypothetical protein GW947_00255 [Candidatus Pacebacteria bacterium]|nr:hypothetical protein [Candidatus Paceibacterota bacterium]PIR59523.1 MAG: hypothetical protein COU68_05195 [Candidatus Pacebacteria bacterium CG10_big_fil_rev_8_21_14_0_10_45_6]